LKRRGGDKFSIPEAFPFETGGLKTGNKIICWYGESNSLPLKIRMETENARGGPWGSWNFLLVVKLQMEEQMT